MSASTSGVDSKPTDKDEFQLFHGRLMGRGRDILSLVWPFVVFPLVALGMRFAYTGSGHIVFLISYWAALLAILVGGARGLYNVFRGGARRWVYGVSSKSVFKKFLRGEHDPLWSATRVSAGGGLEDNFDFDSLDYEHWDLADFAVHSQPDAIVLRGIKPSVIDGKIFMVDGKEQHLEIRFRASDFDDEQVFERLSEALRRPCTP